MLRKKIGHVLVAKDPYGCSTVVLIGFTCPAITVVTVILRALDRVPNPTICWIIELTRCVLAAYNVFVCWCCVGSDRAAEVGVSLGTLDLVRVDGRPCLGRCSHTTISRLRLSDRPLKFSTPAQSCMGQVRAAMRRRVPGFFSGPVGAILEALSRTNCTGTSGCTLEALSRTNCTGMIPRAIIRRLHMGAGEPGMLSPSPACSRRACRRGCFYGCF